MLDEIKIEIRNIEQKLVGFPGGSAKALWNWRELKEQLRQVKIKKLCIESHIASDLPIKIEGFLSEDEDEVDRDEHGRTVEIYHYLGCPVFPTDRPRHYGTVGYNKFQDITEILKQNTGKFLRVTIEAIPIGETKNCAKCDKRFQCLTTKVKG